jgi:hypothetical protein
MELPIITAMTSETSNLSIDTTLSETLEKLVQQQLDLLKIAANSAALIAEFIGKASPDLFANILNTVNQILQGILTAFTAKNSEKESRVTQLQ